MNSVSHLLSAELKRRQLKNQKYSLRAFARLLELEPSAVSKMLKGQRVPTVKTFTQISKKLGLAPEVAARIQKRRQKGRKPSKAFHAFNDEDFEQHLEMYHIIMLEALRLPKYANAVDSLRKTMGMQSKTFYKALRDLEKMNMLRFVKSSNQVRILREHNTTLPMNLTSQKLRSMQRRFLSMAAHALEEVPIEERDNTTLTIAISSQQVAHFKKLLWQFRRRINQEADKKISRADGIYNLTMAFYPVVKTALKTRFFFSESNCPKPARERCVSS